MRHGRLTRDEAIAVVGEEAISKLEGTNCEPTSRLQTDGDDSVEWSAYIRTPDKSGERVTVEAYYYLTPEQMAAMAEQSGDGSAVDWVIEGYEIEGMSHDAVKEFLSRIGAKGGAAKTPAKIAASAANGAKGGRPRLVRKNPSEVVGLPESALDETRQAWIPA